MTYNNLEQIANILREDSEFHYEHRDQIDVPIELSPSSMDELRKDCDKRMQREMTKELINTIDQRPYQTLTSLSFGQTRVNFNIKVRY